MAALSVTLLVALLALMVLAASSGFGSGPRVLGGLFFVVLLGAVVQSFPIIIFVINTMVLRVIESSSNPMRRKARW